MQRVTQAYSSWESGSAGEVDLELYDGFISDADRPLLAKVWNTSKQELVQTRFDFHDKRLPTTNRSLCRPRKRNGGSNFVVITSKIH